MKAKREPFRFNPFSELSEVKLVPVPDQLILTHEPRTQLRSYLTRPEDPLRSLAEALSGGRKPKTVEVEKRIGPEPADQADEPTSAEPTSDGPKKWGR